MIRYAIVDDDGAVYAHDLSSEIKAGILCEEYKKKNPNAPNIEVLESGVYKGL